MVGSSSCGNKNATVLIEEKQQAMWSRNELEGLIVMGLRDIRSLECLLGRRFATLGTAPQKTRLSFLRNLIDLQEKTRRLEKLVSVLNDVTRRNESVAA